MRALELPARGRRPFQPRVAARRNLSRTTSTATAASKRTAPPSSACSSARPGEDGAAAPRGFGPVPGAARRVEFAADDELPAEPLTRAHTTAKTRPPRPPPPAAAGIDDVDDRRRRCARSPASSTGSSSWPRSKEFATSTTRRRRTPPPPPRPWTAYDAPLHVILGGSRQGRSWNVARAGRRCSECVTALYLIGEARSRSPSTLGCASVAVPARDTLDRAVAEAASAASAG